jgi:phosphoglycolate phosphatase-like HAD superfamily hydrolase
MLVLHFSRAVARGQSHVQQSSHLVEQRLDRVREPLVAGGLGEREVGVEVVARIDESVRVGDTARDVLAARGTPLRTVSVHSGKPPQKELTKLREAHMTPTVEAMDLAAATDWILRDRRGEE